MIQKFRILFYPSHETMGTNQNQADLRQLQVKGLGRDAAVIDHLQHGFTKLGEFELA